MQAIGAALPATDGIACFTRMYLGVTQTVAEQVQASAFVDAAWMSRLDVVFANFFFNALDVSQQDPTKTPRCWAPLIQRRADPSVAGIQFALAGMNAHINHDLPQAVVTTCAELQTGPDQDGHHDDYNRINPLLAAAEQAVRESFEAADRQEVDRTVSPVANVICNWGIVKARAAAWTNAEALWELRRLPSLERDFLDVLDGTIGLVSRGLLVPTRERHHRPSWG
jgi:hypothetical protein